MIILQLNTLIQFDSFGENCFFEDALWKNLRSAHQVKLLESFLFRFIFLGLKSVHFCNELKFKLIKTYIHFHQIFCRSASVYHFTCGIMLNKHMDIFTFSNKSFIMKNDLLQNIFSETIGLKNNTIRPNIFTPDARST